MGRAQISAAHQVWSVQARESSRLRVSLWPAFGSRCSVAAQSPQAAEWGRAVSWLLCSLAPLAVASVTGGRNREEQSPESLCTAASTPWGSESPPVQQSGGALGARLSVGRQG